MLTRKLFRTMGRYRAQFISMIVMIALGIGVFVGFNMEWYTIETDTGSFFRDTGLADYRIVSETGFTEEDRAAVEALSGVERASRVLTINASADDGDIVAVNVLEKNNKVSSFLVTEGAAYDPDSADGIWLSDRYAEENGLSLGSSLSLTFRGLEIEGTVMGLVKSGEYLICVPDETQLMPDYTTYGYAYISPALLEKVLGTAYYTQINAVSALSRAEFVKRAEDALGKTLLVLSKDEVISYAEAKGESSEGKTMGSVLPVLFLAIATLTMVTTMHRLTASEKTQIGTLKALGFRDRRIVFHYSSYALTIGLFGTALGLLLGRWIGWFIMNPGGPMGTYFDMPDWSLHTPGFVWVVLVLINLFLLWIGWLSVKAMLKGTAADSLRPYTPKAVRALAVERFSFWDRLGFGFRWNLRDSLRHKTRTLMTLFGVVGCMVLMVGSFGMKDTIDRFVDRYYGEALRYASKISLDADSDGDARGLAEELGGDWSASSSVQIGDGPLALEVYSVTHDMLRFIDEDGELFDLEDGGAYLCKRVADEFGLAPGDCFTFSPFGSDKQYTARVEGIHRSLVKGIAMTADYADSIGFEYRIDSIYTARTDIAPDSRIQSTQTRQSIIDSFDTFMEVMNTMLLLLVIAAAVLGLVVLYNLGVMSYTERYREMATLKVIGFKDKKIGRLLIGQNLWLTVIGSLIGAPLGWLVIRVLMDALAGEYEMTVEVGPFTYLYAFLLTFGVSLVVGWMVARKNRKIDMVEALKIPE